MNTLTKEKFSYFPLFDGLDQAGLHARLQKAEEAGRDCGAHLIIGPVCGDTWHSYRTVITDSGAPPFLLEPFKGKEDNYKNLTAVLTKRHYKIAAQFLSTAISAGATDSGARSISEIAAGLTVKSFSKDCFYKQLEDIYKLSVLSFKNNFLYKEISLEEFVDLYLPLEKLLRGELITMVYDQDELVGLSLGLADTCEKDRFILKTLVRHPAKKYAGLGRALVQESVRIAKREDFTEVIFALYKEDGSSAYIADFYPTRLIRRYALFSRELV